MKGTHWWLATLLLLSVVHQGGCATGESFTISTQSYSIKGGYADHDDSAVLGLVSFGGQGFGTCTGTLISPNVVLTARHCIAPLKNSVQGGVSCQQTTFGQEYDAQSFYLSPRQQLTQNPNDYTGVSAVLVPPDGKGVCGLDMALLILNSPMDSVTPMVPRVDSSIQYGDKYSAIGYGATSDNGGGSGARRRRDNLNVECVGTLCPPYAVADTEWSGNAGVCSGDSGGPAVDSQGRVIGVASRGASGCNYPVYGHVYSWADWIKFEILWAADQAGIKPPKWAEGWPTDVKYSYPVGNSCGADEQCLSNVCYNGYCTRQCVAEAPCSGGFHCEEGSQFCVLSPVGDSCQANGECLSGQCKDGYCTRACENAGPKACPDAYICDGLSKVCTLLPVGGVCEQNNDCETRLCLEGLCTRPCNELAPCPEGTLCDKAQGACVLPPMGDVCADATSCPSELCEEGYCSRQCEADIQCIEDFVCDSATGSCIPAPVGELCQAGVDCATGQCAEGICTRGCDEAFPCPDGFECAGDGMCVVKSGGLGLAGCLAAQSSQAPWALILSFILILGLIRRRQDVAQ